LYEAIGGPSRKNSEEHKAVPHVSTEKARATLARLEGCEQRWEAERIQREAVQASVRDHQSRARRWVDSLIFKTTWKPTAAEIEEKRERHRKSLERAHEVLNRGSTSDQKPEIIYKTYQNSPLTAPVVPVAAAPAAPATSDPDPCAALRDSGAFSSEQVHALGEMLLQYAGLLSGEVGIVERRLTDKILSVENRQLKSENTVLRRQLEERAERDDVIDFNVARQTMRTRNVV
jgi:hypothetical protein